MAGHAVKKSQDAAKDAGRDTKVKAREAAAKELLKKKSGLAAQAASLKPGAATVGGRPEPGPFDILRSWFGGGGDEAKDAKDVKKDPAKKVEPPKPKKPLDPLKDPAKNPDAETESVTGAAYEVVKGTAFIQGKGDDKDIDANDVSQGKLGDCYFVAALAAIAKRSPETLRKKITDNGDGTYVVHFHEGGDVVVDSQFPTKGGKIQFADAGDKDKAQGTELWVMLVEKAWAKLKGGYEVVRGNKIRMSSTDAMQAITGKGTQRVYPARTKEDELFKILENAEEKGWPCTMGVKNVKDPADIKAAKAAGLVPNHAYAILSVDAKGKTLTVYNPWGKEYKVEPVTFDKLQKFVSNININKD